MGCCVSTPNENKANTKQNSLKKDQKFSCVSKSPPRPEEETVKEVLSEIPKLKNAEKPIKSKLVVSPKKPFFEQKLPSLVQKLPYLEQKVSSMEQKLIPIKETKYYHDQITPEEEISEVSEMCSLSESISTTTLEEQQMQWGKDTATNSDVHQRVYRSQGYNSNLLYKNNYNNSCNNHNVQMRNHGRSPVRRANPSPQRRYSGPGTGQVGSMRDVENSARRSRSPATRPNVGRSPSAKRNGPSPGRVRMVHGPDEVRRNGNIKDGGNEWDGPKESLENPLVSLECFIFL